MVRVQKTITLFLSIILLILILNWNSIISAYRWPRENAGGLYGINATYGEFRQSYDDLSEHIHNGVDVEGVVDTPIYAIEDGIAIVSARKDNLESVTIGRFSYVHVKVLVENREEVKEGDLIARVKTLTGGLDPHLHLTDRSGNPLRNGGLNNYADTGLPSVSNMRFYRNNSRQEITGTYNNLTVLNNEVDILVRSFDRQSLGSSNVGVYKIGYQIKNALDNLVLNPTYNIQFDSLPSNVSLIYDTINSTSSVYYYWVTNKMNSDSCWNTKQAIDSESSTDNPINAKFPDGEYKVSVIAEDIKGNGGDITNSIGAESKNILLNNWTPQIKSFTTNSTPDKPLKAGDTIEIKIEFTEQMDTGKKPKVEIWDAKASQWKSLSLSATAWSNSSDGRIKDALLKASATLPDWGETGEGTTQELKVKVTEAYGKGENDVIKKEHSEKDASGKDLKITADLYIPKFNDGSVVPAETNADEPQSVFVGVNLEDNESGFTPGEQVNINIQGVGSTTGQIDAGGKVQATFQSPVTEGTYPVTIEIPKDKAGNESKEKKKNVGTLKVTKKPDSDKHANPDESLDVFGPSLTGNKAPRFGPVQVAIFKSGYAVELSDLLATFGEAADYILPENFSPAHVSTYPVLIIPSAGLANQINSANLREKLTEYVEKGGNLIVLTQPTDECYKLLPDNVESLGYFQDKACYSSTAGIRKYTPALAGQSDATLDGTADGVIISWPENAETWLYRLKNNFPALIAYQCGQGRVVVSNYYSDYAHGHSQLNGDEKALLRDLLSWGRDFGELSEVRPGEAQPISVPVHYAAGGMEAGVARVRLVLRNPDRKSVVTQEVPLEMAAGETKTVSFDFNDADQSLSKNSLGIWWLNYELLDADGKVVQAEREGQRVALSEGLKASNQSTLLITVNPTITMALEGTKIPFKIIARNSGPSNCILTYKVNAVLGSSSGNITKREEIGSGSWVVGNNDQYETTLELDSFKAYTSSINNSWAKNWWEFEFFDETGKIIVKEMRGVSVYKPAVKTKYELWDLTNPNAEVFKPGDEIRLNYQFENLVPVGYPIQWEVTVKAVNQNQKIIYQKTGNGFIDPVIDENVDFTIPTDCSIDKYQVDFIISSNGTVIPTMCNQDNSPTSADYNLSIANFRTTLEGIKFDLSNKGTNFADYVIISRFYGKQFVEEHFTGTINASIVETKFIPLKADMLSTDKLLACYLINLATGVEQAFIYITSNKLKFNLNSVQQDKNAKNLVYNLTIENTGTPISGAQLKVFNDELSFFKKYTLPDFGIGQMIDCSVDIPFSVLSGSKPYPIQFVFCYADNTEVLAYKHYPQISLESFGAINYGIVLKAINKEVLDTDFKLSYQIYNSGIRVDGGEQSGLLVASETKQLTIPVKQFNPFNRYQFVGKLVYPSSGQEQNINQWIEPLKVELNAPKEQTVTGSKFSYDISLANTGPEFSNLKLSMTLSHPVLQRDFAIPALATGETCEFKGELELPGGLTPGTYNITYHVVNTNGEKFSLGSGSYTILAPQLAINPPIKTEFIPGESYGVSIKNIGVFSTIVNYEFRIYDKAVNTVITQNGSINLGPNQESCPVLPIGVNWASSRYCLHWKITTSPIKTYLSGYKAFTVNGVETGLAVATDQNIYRPDQSVIAKARFTNGNYPVNGNLELSVSRLASGGGERIDGWPCFGGNNQRTGWSKLPGNISNPGIRWHKSCTSISKVYPLIGNVDDEVNNEIVTFDFDNLNIIDGASGALKRFISFGSIFPDCPKPYGMQVTGIVLSDIDNKGSQEVIVCLAQKFMIVLNGNLDIIWSKDFGQPILTANNMMVVDLDGDQSKEILLDNIILKVQNGAVINTETKLGTVADINRDGSLEVVTQEAVFDREFNEVVRNNYMIETTNLPILADINRDGFMEIILYNENGVYVFDKSYSLLWSQSAVNLQKIVAGDLYGDGYQELIAVDLITNTDETYSFRINCFSSEGNLLWRKVEGQFYIWNNDSNKYCDAVLNDWNNDGRLELIFVPVGLILDSMEGIFVYNTQDGEKLWEKGYSIDSPLAVGDVDGDGWSEIVAFLHVGLELICFDNVQIKESVVILPKVQKEAYRTYIYEWEPYFYHLQNGTILVQGNKGVYYFRPKDNCHGVISIPNLLPRNIIFQEIGDEVEIWQQDNDSNYKLLGMIDSNTLQFTESTSNREYRFYYQHWIKNGKYYFYQFSDEPKEELFVEDLKTGLINSLGVVSPDNEFSDIVGVIDDQTLLVISNGNLCRLNLVDLNLTMLNPFPYDFIIDAMWSGSNEVILQCYTDYNDIEYYKYDLLQNKLELLVTGTQLEERISELGYQLGYSFDSRYLVCNSNEIYVIFYYAYEGSGEAAPFIYKYNNNSNSIEEAAPFTTIGKMSGLTKIEDKYYFTLNSYLNGFYSYDPVTQDIQNYPLTGLLFQEAKYAPNSVRKLFNSPDGRLCIWNWSDPAIYLFDLNTGLGSKHVINLPEHYNIEDMKFGESPNLLYVNTINSWNHIYKLFVYNLLDNTLLELDYYDYTKEYYNYYNGYLVYDDVKQKLFYNFGKNVKCLDLKTGEISEICELNSRRAIALLGARDDKLYFHWSNFNYNIDYYFNNYRNTNIWEYSLNDKQFNLLYSLTGDFDEIYNDFLYFYPAGRLSDHFIFDGDGQKIYVFNNFSIYEYDLVKLTDDPNPFDTSGNRYQEECVIQKTIPIGLAAGETKELTANFGPLTQPDNYALQGRLTNTLDQTIAISQSHFAVSDNGLGLTITGDKRYYRPAEPITINGSIFNITGTTSDPLKLTVTRRGSGQTNVVREEDLILNAGEQRPFTLNFNESVEGEYVIEAKLIQNGATIGQAQLLFTVAKPQVEAELDIPSVVGSKPVSALIKLTNKSPYPVTVNAASELLQLAEPLTLGAGETALFARELTLTGDSTLLLTITGDVTANYQRTIIFNEKADLAVTLPAQVPTSARNIAYRLSNTGSVAAEFPVGLTLYRDGAQVAQYNTVVHLNPNQSLTGEWPVDLIPGDYRLVYSTLNQTKEINFTCLPDYAATLTATSELAGLDELKIKLNASNTGCNPIMGVIKLESEFTEQSIPVEIASGVEYANELTVIDLPVIAGTYELKISLEAMGMVLAAQTISFTREETVPPAPEMTLVAIPVNLIGGAGQELPVTVKVRNSGDAAGDCILELNSEAVNFSDATVINLAPGAEAEHTFKLLIPAEMESGTYQGRIIVNGTATHFPYQVNGYKLEAVASLDKAAYLKGETATLTIAVQNKGGQANIPLTVRVKQGNFDETREITLGSSANLTYRIPVDDFNQKIFYGFYHSSTGRSLLLDVHNIYEAAPEFTAVPDKQRYRAGETVHFNVQTNQEGWLAVAGPNDFYRFEPVNGSRSYAIPLPGDLRTGTYGLWAAFAGKTLEYKIDVIGYDIRFAAGKLDQSVYQNGEPFQLDTVVASGENITCEALVELVKPDETVQPIATEEVQLTTGENGLSFKGIVNSDQTGAHRIRVRFQLGDLTVSRNDFSFRFGKEELLGITCSRNEYFNGTEPVSGEIHLYGQGSGSVIIYLDGQAVTTLTAEVNGNTVIPYSIGSSYLKPGPHTLSAVYQGVGGQSGTVKTQFDYGVGLPDLTVSNINVSKERGADGAIPITVTVQKGNALPAKEVKVEVALGNELIGEYIIPELSGEDAADTRTILWQAGDFSGEAELKATVNYDNRVLEYDTANNTAATKVVIPMVPQVSGLPALANDPRLPITGQTTPGVLVCLYDGQGMIDFGYADASGNFSLTGHCLNQGENRLRLKARNRDGWESLFSEEITVILDAAPPQISVDNLEDNRHYNYDILPEITIEESEPAEIEYTLDGQVWVPGNPITAEGQHQLWIMVTDGAGNRSEKAINFVIDKTPPEVTITGPADGAYYNIPQIPAVSVNDINPVTTELTLNGEPYQGSAINEDGTYLLEVLAYDQAGNTVTRQIGFTIDRTEPEIQISGVADGETYREAVTPVIEVIEANPEEVVMLLNGQPFVSGTAIIVEGNYELTVTAVDKAGNQAVSSVKFIIDQESGGNYTVFCDSLFIRGDLKADQVFCNDKLFYLKGDVDLGYLGITVNHLPHNSCMKIEQLETGLARQALPKPDWMKLCKATTLIRPGILIPGKTYSNIRVEGNLHLSGEPKLTGILVVKGNLTIARDTKLDNPAIFCGGKVTVAGNSRMTGLLYAGREVRINGDFKLTGGIITENLTINGDTELSGGDIDKYEEWFAERVKKRHKHKWHHKHHKR